MATKKQKILYWVATGFMLFVMLWSFVTYHLLHDVIAEIFIKFNYPTYLIYPLAWLKLAGVIILITNRYSDLKEWVYATYYINMILAFVAHFVAQDFYWHAVLGLILIPVSYIYSNAVRGIPENKLISFSPT
jgi:hypothetical protein